MTIKLKQLTTEVMKNIFGDVISRRHCYVIRIRRHWYSCPEYVNLIGDWVTALNNDVAITIELVDNPDKATKFRDSAKMSAYSKEWAERVIEKIKQQPDKFVLA
jgi:hypothetical protein